MYLIQKLRGLVLVSVDFLRAIQDHSMFTHAAACAFFLFLSIPPALLALVTLIGLIPIEDWTEATTLELFDWAYWIAGIIVPADVVDFMGLGYELRFQPTLAELNELSAPRIQAQVSELFQQALPPAIADDLEGIMENILGNPRRGLLTVSFLTILWSASGVTRAAMRAMGAIYEVKLRSMIKRNSLSLVLTIGYLISWTIVLALLPVSNTVSVMVVNYFGLDQGVHLAWSGVNWMIGAAMLMGSVLFLNRLGPDVELRLRALLPGSLLTVVLWILLSRALTRWLEQSWQSYNSTYGALAAIIVLLLWCYLMAIGLLLGAELNTAILRLRARGLEAAGDDLNEATRAAVEAEISPMGTSELAAKGLALGGLGKGQAKSVDSGRS